MCPEAGCNGTFVTCVETTAGVTATCVSQCKNGYCYNDGLCFHDNPDLAPQCRLEIKNICWQREWDKAGANVTFSWEGEQGLRRRYFFSRSLSLWVSGPDKAYFCFSPQSSAKSFRLCTLISPRWRFSRRRQRQIRSSSDKRDFLAYSSSTIESIPSSKQSTL